MIYFEFCEVIQYFNNMDKSDNFPHTFDHDWTSGKKQFSQLTLSTCQDKAGCLPPVDVLVWS